MSKTYISTSDATSKKLWDERIFREIVKETYFQKFMAETPNSLVYTKTDLTKGKGDAITFTLRMRLTGDGVTSGQTLEGNEANLTYYTKKVSLEEYAYAVRDAGPLDRQRPAWDVDEEGKQAIVDWGTEKVDKLCFDAITASPTTIWYNTGSAISKTTTESTATGAITSTGLITPAMVSKVKAWAMTGGNRSQPPLTPIKYKGKNHYIFLIHPDVAFDMKNNSQWQQAMREAERRGPENPLFAGASFIWDDVVIHEHENVPIVTNWGSSSDVAGAKNIFMGACALLFAWGKRPTTVSEEFDYEREHGHSIQMICGVTKATFNSKDFGSIGFYTARSKISDA